MRTTETKRIGDHEWTITQLPGPRALELFTKMVQMFGQPLVMAAAGGIENLDSELVYALAPAIGALRIPPGEMTKLADELLIGALMDGSEYKPSTAALIFRGKVCSWLQVMLFAVQCNYGDFADGFAALKGALKTTKPTPESKPEVET